MNPALDDPLDRCLQQLSGAGGGCPDSLSADSAELLPLIELARQIASLPAPEISAVAQERNRERMLARVGRPQPGPLSLHDPARSNGHPEPARGWKMLLASAGLVRAGALAALLLVLSTAFAVNASAQSLPGQTLYPVKIAVEQVRISLASDPAQRSALQQFFQSERQDDIQKAAAERQSVQVEFQGVLQEKGFTTWLVGKLWVTVSSQTALVGYPQVGDVLAVTVRTEQDGALAAEEIQVLAAPAPQGTSSAVPSSGIPVSPAPTAAPLSRPASGPHPRQKPGAKPAHQGGVPPASTSTAVPPAATDTPMPPTAAAVGLNPSASPSPTATDTPPASATPSVPPTLSPTPSPSGTPTDTPTAPTATLTLTALLPYPTATATFIAPSGAGVGLPPPATPAPTDYFPTTTFELPTLTPTPTDTSSPSPTSVFGTGILPQSGVFPTLQAFGPPNPIPAIPTWLPMPPPAATFAASGASLVVTPTP